MEPQLDLPLTPRPVSLPPATPDLQNSFHSACFDDGGAKESYGLPEEMHDFGCGARQCPANYTCEVQCSAARGSLGALIVCMVSCAALARHRASGVRWSLACHGSLPSTACVHLLAKLQASSAMPTQQCIHIHMLYRARGCQQMTEPPPPPPQTTAPLQLYNPEPPLRSAGFGNVGESMLTCFQVITVSWRKIGQRGAAGRSGAQRGGWAKAC